MDSDSELVSEFVLFQHVAIFRKCIDILFLFFDVLRWNTLYTSSPSNSAGGLG